MFFFSPLPPLPLPQDVQYADIDHMDRRLDFTYDKENFAGLPEYIRQVKSDGLRFIIILDPAINAEVCWRWGEGGNVGGGGRAERVGVGVKG